MESKFKMTIDGKTYNVKLEDNELTKEILNLCPFEDEFQRYGEHEYYCRLQKDISKANAIKTSKANKNKLYYFAGWNAFTIVFEDCDISPFEINFIGELEEDSTPQLRNSFDKIHVKCEVK